jgi:DNA-binding transcriptional MerR regulator
MKFKISDVSKISRISPSGLRFYEKAGIIAPARGENQKYRDFTQRELDIIFEYKTYRSLGFTKNEALSLMTDDSPADLLRKYETCQERVLREIEEKQLLADFITRQTEQIRISLSQPHVCVIEDNPAILRLKMWQPGVQEGQYAPFSALTEWYDRIPFVDACFLYPAEGILNENEILAPDLGVGLEQKYADALHFIPKAAAERIPAQPCIHTFIEITEESTIRSADLAFVRQFIAENHLSICGKAIARHIYNLSYRAENIRLDHLWIPLAP